MTNKKFPSKGWLYVDKSYQKLIAHALTLPKLLAKIENTKQKGVITKANKQTNAYIG